VTVGAVDPNTQQNFYGSGKPVDISSIGDAYPSTGGRTAAGVGTHNGTSAASPAVAGTIARVLQRARIDLGDTTNGYANGVVAEGEPQPCGTAIVDCALGDGVLTRRELVESVYHSVLPVQGSGSPLAQTLPTTEHAYYYVGHGVVRGMSKSATEHEAEVSHMVDVLRGVRKPFTRPAGERTWFIVDSQCRQKLWGSWSGGYFTGTAPQPSASDPLALAFHAWCSNAPDDTFGPLT
ncbi:MAG TPA: S8 family serine peptidase, partial [Actinomycetota bacterium]|nr:S8 family serine peptidase [Actinomycetota bacterium]